MTEPRTPPPETAFKPVKIPDGIIEMNGQKYMTDAKGSLVPRDLVRAQDALQDETVRKIIGYGKAISAQVSRFKAHTYADIADFEAILAQEYETTIGGAKGNKTLMTYDGLFKVQVQMADLIDFGPELQIAKQLVDECLIEWAAESRPELGAVVTRAFNTDKEGQINRGEIIRLTKLEIEDPRWQRGMKAIKDAMRTVGSKSYVRCYERADANAQWQAITIDLAKA